MDAAAPITTAMERPQAARTGKEKRTVPAYLVQTIPWSPSKDIAMRRSSA
jgi:hypothetical protein